MEERGVDREKAWRRGKSDREVEEQTREAMASSPMSFSAFLSLSVLHSLSPSGFFLHVLFLLLSLSSASLCLSHSLLLAATFVVA